MGPQCLMFVCKISIHRYSVKEMKEGVVQLDSSLHLTLFCCSRGRKGTSFVKYDKNFSFLMYPQHKKEVFMYIRVTVHLTIVAFIGLLSHFYSATSAVPHQQRCFALKCSCLINFYYYLCLHSSQVKIIFLTVH